MKKVFYYLKQFSSWLVIVLQIVVGVTVIKTGYDLAAGNLYPSSSVSNDPITPLFLIAIGIYFCFAGLLRRFFGDKR